ncbi:MAG: NADH-ubiquinone oxidoreductase-F iron-sulfur binding region domain-containing protein [Actinomycetota bacterium]|nr:NADH-ubiquinone oxidoreductase-F iron-sulfur binding region domain-containing protein [Actinomycetota bacterium]
MSANDVTHQGEIAAIVRTFAEVRGGLLPALHAVQHHAGYIDRAHIPLLADVFNLSVAEVHGVISFYNDFRTDAPAGPAVQVCRGEACQARGGDRVWAAAQTAPQWGGVEVHGVFCVGNCALGPNVMVGGEIHPIRDEGDLENAVGLAVRGRDEPVAAHSTVEGDTVGEGISVYVPCDASARAEGADHVAAALAATPGMHVVRTGSRGMAWLEPLIEVATAHGRVAYGPVSVTEVPGLLAAGLLEGGAHELCLGPVDELPWMKAQQRVTFGRVGVIDPRSADDYLAHGGMVGLQRAISMSPAAVVAEIADSGLRGRGGAAFPAGIKLRTVLDTPSEQKYVVANADEGDSGSFADRMLMEGDPFLLIEGMLVAGWATGANDGYLYIRSEYPDAITAMRSAITSAQQRGWLGESVLGSGFAFRVHLRVGAGAYICGEETALMESIEGKRGVVRAKPPLPAVAGLWGKPTVINNVLTLAAMPSIMADGAAAYAALGLGRSRGTQVLQLAGNVAQGGLVEVPFGITVRDLVERFGGGTNSGRPVRAVQVGGPLGGYLSPDDLDLPIDYEAFAAAGALLGHGSVVVFDDTVDMLAMARFAMEFCAAESCGKCTPCRIGSTRGVELIDKIAAGIDRDANLELLDDLCEVMADASLCAMGGFTPLPVRSAMALSPGDFGFAADFTDHAPSVSGASA